MIIDLEPSTRFARTVAFLAALLFGLGLMTGPPRGWSAEFNAEEEIGDPTAEAIPADEISKARATIERLRDVGTALYSHMVEDLERRGAQPEPSEEGGWEDGVMDWSECPLVTAAAVQAIVVPKILPELPTTDGWGHPLEFCLADDFTRDRAVLGVRSPGSDGVYSGDRYRMGPFLESEMSHDVVWIDGYFATFPMTSAQIEKYSREVGDQG